jgi:hypothetical protein
MTRVQLARCAMRDLPLCFDRASGARMRVMLLGIALCILGPSVVWAQAVADTQLVAAVGNVDPGNLVRVAMSGSILEGSLVTSTTDSLTLRGRMVEGSMMTAW